MQNTNAASPVARAGIVWLHRNFAAALNVLPQLPKTQAALRQPPRWHRRADHGALRQGRHPNDARRRTDLRAAPAGRPGMERRRRRPDQARLRLQAGGRAHRPLPARRGDDLLARQKYPGEVNPRWVVNVLANRDGRPSRRTPAPWQGGRPLPRPRAWTVSRPRSPARLGLPPEFWLRRARPGPPVAPRRRPAPGSRRHDMDQPNAGSCPAAAARSHCSTPKARPACACRWTSSRPTPCAAR